MDRDRLTASLGRRFARLATNAVVRRPGLWRLFRGPLRRQFDRLAPHWDEIIQTDHLAALELALERVEPPPGRALDLGTGTGAAALPFEDGAFDLVTHANMIPFFDELERVVAPGGYVVFGFSGGSETPIYVDPVRLRAELERRGFTHFAELEAGRGTAFLARKGEQG